MEKGRVKEEKGLIELQIQYQESGREEPHNKRFKTYRDLALRSVFLDFCDTLGLVYSSIEFLFEGVHIKETQSAEEFGLDDGDLIDAFNTQDGGAAAAAR